jgi:tight adherence protein C
MTLLEMLFLGLVFAGVFGASFVLLGMSGRSAMRERIDSLADNTLKPRTKKKVSWAEKLQKYTQPLAKLSLPEENWETSLIRKRFINAGFRHPATPALYFAAKTMLALVLPLLLFLVLSSGSMARASSTILLYLLLAAALGYYLPNMVLNRAVTARQREILNTFPDALDLMTICVEAGLAIDSALSRVAGEIGLNSPVLSEELTLVTLELRAGGSKEKALRNLALRTGVEDVDALVAMLIQAERFGTSIAASLRVQSDMLRTKRRLRAEETAAQLGLKLLFPLIFFIFPTLMVVLLGPAIIQIYRVLLPSMSGGG